MNAVLRAATADEAGFVLKSWLQSYRDEGDNTYMENDVYYAVHKPRIIDILSRSTVVIAANPDDDWHSYGWVAFGQGVVHYVYVKSSFRRMGVATKLFDAAGRPAVATHTGWLFKRLRNAWSVAYDPRRA